MSDANVVGFPGYKVPLAKGEPVGSIVKALEDFLEQARAGQIRALGMAVVINDGTDAPLMTNFFEVHGMHGSQLESEIARLTRRYGKWRDGD